MSEAEFTLLIISKEIRAGFLNNNRKWIGKKKLTNYCQLDTAVQVTWLILEGHFARVLWSSLWLTLTIY